MIIGLKTPWDSCRSSSTKSVCRSTTKRTESASMARHGPLTRMKLDKMQKWLYNIFNWSQKEVFSRRSLSRKCVENCNWRWFCFSEIFLALFFRRWNGNRVGHVKIVPESKLFLAALGTGTQSRLHLLTTYNSLDFSASSECPPDGASVPCLVSGHRLCRKRRMSYAKIVSDVLLCSSFKLC
jgi:hypothetical protein